MTTQRQRLYINIDHIATVRQARRGLEPVPADAVPICEQAGADGITAHLREDRRHIQDHDIDEIAKLVTTVLNLEIACTPEMIALAERLRPYAVTLDPDVSSVTRAHDLGADAVELHTGSYAHAHGSHAALHALRTAAQLADSLGLAVHAGHGLTTANVGPVAAIPELQELNIGHHVISRAIFVGLETAIRELRAAMDEARDGA